MNVTVSDCLKLPALREARVMAGERGLNRVVSQVTVLEYPDVAALSSDLLVGNELMISALTQIKDNVDAQCRIIRHLHSMGAACLIVYYVGIFVLEINDRLIETSNELDFPLIAMPFGRMDFRYCDAIMDVTELIIFNQKQEKNYVSDMVNRISLLQPQYRTINAVLRLLSDRLRCTLLLTDRYLERKGAAAWPLSNQWDYPKLLEKRKTGNMQSAAPREEIIGDKRATVWDLPVNSKVHRGFHLFALDEEGNHEYDMLQQAAEVIELFLNIWNKNTYYDGTDALIHAIINDRPDEMARLASQMHIDFGSLNIMWIMQISDDKYGLTPNSNQKLGYILKLKMFLQEYHNLTIVDSYDQYVIALAGDKVFESSEYELAKSFAEGLLADGFTVAGVTFEDIKNTSEARACFVMTDKNLAAAQTIYPTKAILNKSEISFAGACMELVNTGEEAVKGAMDCLHKLQAQRDGAELMQTLCVYLMDAESNTKRTGEILFLHKNSINYRLNRIKGILGFEISQMPEAIEIYRAAAVFRLIS